MKNPLPYLLATLTQHDRQIMTLGVDFEWSDESWTSNLFRFNEWVWGRRIGIRPYTSCFFSSEGAVRYPRLIQFHTIESIVCYAETCLRRFLTTFELAPFRIVFPAFAGGMVMPSPSPYWFAIARDTSTNFGGGSGSTTVTYANYPMATTSSGALFFGMYGSSAGDLVTAQTFNSLAMTKITAQAPGYRQGYLFYKLGATGTHDIVITFSIDPGGSDGTGFSYTGCATSAIDSTATNTAAAAGGVTTTTTVVASNCWLAGFCIENAGSALTAGAGTSIIRNGGNFAGMDSNGTVGTGSQSLVVTDAGTGGFSLCIASFAPLVSAINSGFFMLMT